MTTEQLIKHLRHVERINRRDIKQLAKLKLKLDAALDAQRRGHEHLWPAVQKQLDKIDDIMDCAFLATEL